jgi:hypothetical protein
MGDCNIIELENGLRKGIAKLKNILEGIPEQPFNADEYSLLYTYPLEKISTPSLAYSLL